MNFTNIYVVEFIFLSVEPALKPRILGVSDRVGVVVPATIELVISDDIPHLSPLQPAGPVGGGGELVRGGTGGAPVCSRHLAPGDGRQGSGNRAASDQHLENIIRLVLLVLFLNVIVSQCY